LPRWTVVPFPVLVLAIALLPMIAPRAWERRSVQLLIVSACAAPILFHFVAAAKTADLVEAATSYVSFVTTLGALYVTAGGIVLSADVEATPSTNVAFILVGATLASLIGTTGASMLLIRPLLWTNRRREHRAHLLPFFIVAVANAGGLLTPLGDPPLLVGYISGVPFFWTLRLFPAWLLYVGWSALALYWVDRRAHASELPAAVAAERSERGRITLRGKRNLALMLLVVPAAMLPAGGREIAMLVISVASLSLTPSALHRDNGFSFGPITDVAVIFAGLFACLGPVRTALDTAAPYLPFRRAWQLFWAAGAMSSVLDNAPTYSAFAALARGLSQGDELVAGISIHKLAAISIGSVVMGATTYIGNGPNLMVKAIAERERFPAPGFFRYAAFTFVLMLPAHLVTTLALAHLDSGGAHAPNRSQP
jgi:Na+/H+ antiporter NhaD/arsenite permease-like protein